MALTALRAISTKSLSRHIAMPGALRHDQRFAAQEVGDVVLIQLQPVRARASERIGHVGILHEPITKDDVEHALAQRAHGDLLVGWHVRHRLRRHHQRDDVLVEHLVVAEVVDQCRRRAARLRGHEYRRAWTRARARVSTVGEKVLDRQRPRRQPRRHQLASGFPGGHEREQAGRQ